MVDFPLGVRRIHAGAPGSQAARGADVAALHLGQLAASCATPRRRWTSRDECARPVTRLTEVLKLPALPRKSCRGVYTSLAEFVAADVFNVTEATRWTRDRMVENGLRVNWHDGRHRRPYAAYGGCPLYRRPAPHADEIAAAFVSNVLSRAVAADIDLTEEEIQTVHTWFGAP